MLEEKESLLKKNRLFDIRRYKKDSTAYEKAKDLYFAITIVVCFLLVVWTYLLSDASHIYRITVEGNTYLKDEDVIALSSLSEKERFYLTIPSLVEKRIKKDPLIASADVKLLPGRLVRISVEEKKIVGYAPENGLNVLILEDGERVGISKERMYLIACAPIIEGFDEKGVELLVKQLNSCEKKIIEQISEIHYFPQLKYQNVELVMADGNYVFTSPYGLEILNHYFDIESSYNSEKYQCYYFEDISGNAYTSACPWQSVEEEPSEVNTEEDIEEEDE